ncbi:MAG: beta-galactosidase trimerization domain-containing protein [Planctomycetes bacterium]|nr:beta-galactosidase trimerization domain-containing protein [Planctomycetota bacterium]
MPKPDEPSIEFNPCIDLWMAGIRRGGANLPADIEKLKGFRGLLEQLKAVGATGVRIFPETYCCANKMPWKSEFCPDYGKEILKPLIDGLHNHGYKTYIFLHAWISPIQKEGKQAPMPWRRWDYPYEQSDFIFSKGYDKYYKVKYPCVICEDDFRDKWLGIMKEVVGLGIDGVYVMPDEYYFKGHHLETTKCVHCKREFEKRFGYETFPKPVGQFTMVTPDGEKDVWSDNAQKGVSEEDIEHYCKWKLFEYEKVAELFNEVAVELKEVKPGLELIASANPAPPIMKDRRMEHGCAMDVIGRGENFTGVQLYGSVPVELGKYTAMARRMKAAYPHAELVGSIQSLSFKSRPSDFSVRFYGYILPFVMSGVRKIDAYRLNYLHANDWWPHVVRGVRMVRLLEKWGIAKSRSPAETCMLYSRASEDWWQLRVESLMDKKDLGRQDFYLLYEGGREEKGSMDTSKRQQKINEHRLRGPISHRQIEGLLIERGIQYDVKYTDHPEQLEDLSKYRLLILPFGYAMSQAAVEAIRKAVDEGARLLIFDRLGEVNQYGVRHKEPLLKGLVKDKNVKYRDVNLAANRNDEKVCAGNLKAIREMLGETGYHFDPKNASVEYLVRKIDSKNYILYLANWEKEKSAAPVIGLSLPEGTYRLAVCSSNGDGLNEGLVSGKKTPSGGVLRRFEISLSPGEVKLIRVQPKK